MKWKWCCITVDTTVYKGRISVKLVRQNWKNKSKTKQNSNNNNNKKIKPKKQMLKRRKSIKKHNKLERSRKSRNQYWVQKSNYLLVNKTAQLTNRIKQTVKWLKTHTKKHIEKRGNYKNFACFAVRNLNSVSSTQIFS